MTAIVIILTILFVLFISLIRTQKRRCDAMPADRYAHRGLHGDGIAENSISAFKAAAERNLAVELDIQLTADKKLVVFHDTSLKRVCGADTTVAEHTYEELQQFRLCGTEDTIPLFADVLAIMNGLPIICEIKAQGSAADTAICPYAAEALDAYGGSICMESFSPFYVRWFRKNRPDTIRGQLACNFREDAGMNLIEKLALRNLLFNILTRPDFIAYRYTDDSVGFKLCRELFNPICIAWTTKGGAAEAEAKKQERFDAVIFEKDSEINAGNNDTQSR